MVFLEYERAKIKYSEAQMRFDEALTEQERLLTRTMPNAIRYDKVNVKTSQNGNVLDDYVIAKEEKKIDKKISRLRQLLTDREKLLRLKERELRVSKDNLDQVYCMRFVDNKRTYLIAKTLNYSESQIYRILDKIQRIIEKSIKF